MGAAPLVATFLALVSIGCATKSTDGGAPAALASESRAAEQPGSSAAVAEEDAAAIDPTHNVPTIEDTIDLFLSHYAQRLGAVEVHRRAIPGGGEVTLSSSNSYRADVRRAEAEFRGAALEAARTSGSCRVGDRDRDVALRAHRAHDFDVPAAGAALRVAYDLSWTDLALAFGSSAAKREADEE